MVPGDHESALLPHLQLYQRHPVTANPATPRSEKRNIRACLHLRKLNLLPHVRPGVIDSYAKERKAFLQFYRTCPRAIAGRKGGLHTTIHLDGVTEAGNSRTAATIVFLPDSAADRHELLKRVARFTPALRFIRQKPLSQILTAASSKRFAPRHSRMRVRII